MTDWREHLTPDEAVRLNELAAQSKAGTKERQQIYDRAKKRAKRSA